MDIKWYGYFIILSIHCFFSNGEKNSQKLSVKSQHVRDNKLLLISVAGFRGDYAAKLNCSNLQEFIANGTSASYVRNPINIASIANHYSIVTGLYSESHGIISNTMFDPMLNRVFNSKTRAQPEWWTNVHPIWKEVEKQRKGLCGLCHWPGVYGPMISSLRCGQRQSLKADINQAIQWLKNDVKLVLLYSDDIKNAALKWGPFSRQALIEIGKFDSVLKYLMAKARELDFNIVLTSDGGVTDLKWNQVIDLDRCIKPSSYVLMQAQSTLLIHPKQGYSSMEIYKNLTKCPHIKAYLKENMPAYFHFSHNRRIPPVIAFVPLGSVVRSGKAAHWHINKILQGSFGVQKDMGGSGYHPEYEDMRGVFYAYGPSFRSGLKYDAISNTDIYGIMCTILGLTPHSNNASFHIAKSLVNFEVRPETSPTITEQSSVSSPPTKPIRRYSRNHALLGDLELRGFLIFLGSSAGLIILLCCIGCLNTMRKNTKEGFQKKTPVYPPLLNTNLTSDEESP